MKNKSLVLSLLIGVVLVLAVITTISAATGPGDLNISITSIVNGTIEASTNASTIIIEFKIYNGTGLNGTNFSYSVGTTGAGVGATLLHYLLCNSTNATTGTNVTGCLGMGVSNYLYLNLSEGLHSIEINASVGGPVNDSTSLNCTVGTPAGCNTSFVITNFQSLAFVSTVPVDFLNFSGTTINANVTFNSVIVRNVTFFLWKNKVYGGTGMNFTGGSYHNMTRNSSEYITTAGLGYINMTIIPGGSNHSFNYTWMGVPTGWYTFNVTLEDKILGVNFSVERHIILDTTAPNASSISCSGWYNENEATVEKDNTLSCTCSAVEENGTISYTYSPSATPSTTTLGLFGVTCQAEDNSGNNGSLSSILTYTVIELGSGDAPGGGSSSTRTVITGTTFAVTTAQFTAGHTGQLSPNDGFKVSFKSSASTGPQTHIIKVSQIATDSATIILESEPITIKLNTGEEKSVDIDGDGIYDVYVKLNTVTDGKADFTIKQIAQEVPEGEGPVSGGTGLDEEPAPSEGGISLLTWVIVLIIIVILVAVILSVSKSKAKNKKKK